MELVSDEDGSNGDEEEDEGFEIGVEEKVELLGGVYWTFGIRNVSHIGLVCGASLAVLQRPFRTSLLILRAFSRVWRHAS